MKYELNMSCINLLRVIYYTLQIPTNLEKYDLQYIIKYLL